MLFTAQIGLNLLIIGFFSAPENRQLRIFLIKLKGFQSAFRKTEMVWINLGN